MHAIGLCGLEILAADSSVVKVDASMLTILLECDGADASAHLGVDGGGYLDAGYAACLFSGGFSSKVKEDMWLLPVLQHEDLPPSSSSSVSTYTLRIDLGRATHVRSMRIWNYNSSLEGSYRGVKRLVVTLDSIRVSPPVGYLIRKGPGPMGRNVAYEQTIRLRQLSERIGTVYIYV